MAGAGRGPLEAQGRHRDLPPVVDLTDPECIGNAHAVEEDLVERCRAAHLPNRTDHDARGIHGYQERGDARLLDDIGISAREQHAVVGELRIGRPDLLAVDDPVIAVAHSLGGEACEVRSGTGLAEQLAAQHVGAQKSCGKTLALLRGPEDTDSGTHKSGGDADDLRGWRHVEGALLLGEGHAVDAGHPRAAVLGPEGDGAVTRVVTLAPVLAHPIQVDALVLLAHDAEDLQVRVSLTPYAHVF